MSKATDHGPSYYRDGGIQPIKYIQENKLNFCEGNVVKYITRWRTKGGISDLRKAKHYIDLLIEYEIANTDEPLDEIYDSVEDEAPFNFHAISVN